MATSVSSSPFAVTKDLQRPNSPDKIKFVCRWGGDLRPDSQGRLAFDGGETRLCTLPGAVRYRELVQKLRELTAFPAAAEMSLKYQLPGHSMEELISLRSNEDLDIFKEEHNDLMSNFMQGSPAQRIRLFVLPSTQSKRQSSMSGDSLTEPQASKEPSNLLNHHKLRTSHSERDLPNLIPSHPDGGGHIHHPVMSSRSFSTGLRDNSQSLQPSTAAAAVPLGTMPRGGSLGEPSSTGIQDKNWLRRGSTASSLTRDASDQSVGTARSTADDAEAGTWMGSQRFSQSGYVSNAPTPSRPSWTTSRPSSSPHGPPTLPRDPMRASAIISAAHQQDEDDDDDDSASGSDRRRNKYGASSSDGSDRGRDKYGASSSDSEDEALEQLRTTSRRPSTNYRPEFAAKTLAQVKAMLGGPKSGKEAAMTDDETIEKCLSEVEAALNAGLNFKGKFNSGLQVIAGLEAPAVELKPVTAATAQPPPSPSQQPPQPASPAAVAPASPAANAGSPAHPKKKVQIVVPIPSQKAAGPIAQGKASPGGHGAKMPPRLMVGSGMATGEWTGSGKWQEVAEAAMEIPSSLQQIESNDLTKIKELGRGQFGSVWLCRWLGVEVAVKELHGTNSVQNNAEMFGEAETLNSLRHPCIIAFYGVVVNQESPASVLEYVRGSSLRSGLQKLKQYKIPNDKRVRTAIALQAARGMEYLHSRRVVHFDLKCDNLLCDLRDLNRPVVKIADLGLSKKKAATFVSGNMRGTLPWMAPELFPSMQQEEDPELQEDRVNEKVDVFSFGVCMWEIWTWAEMPYPGLGLPEIFAGVMNGTLRPSKPKDCDPAWVAVMEKCWMTQPSKRASFTDIADALDALVIKYDTEQQSTQGKS